MSKPKKYTDAPACVFAIVNTKTNEAYIGATEVPTEHITEMKRELRWGNACEVQIISEHWYWNSNTLYKQLVVDAIDDYSNMYTVINKRKPVAHYDDCFLFV